MRGHGSDDSCCGVSEPVMRERRLSARPSAEGSLASHMLCCIDITTSRRDIATALHGGEDVSETRPPLPSGTHIPRPRFDFGRLHMSPSFEPLPLCTPTPLPVGASAELGSLARWLAGGGSLGLGVGQVARSLGSAAAAAAAANTQGPSVTRRGVVFRHNNGCSESSRGRMKQGHIIILGIDKYLAVGTCLRLCAVSRSSSVGSVPDDDVLPPVVIALMHRPLSPLAQHLLGACPPTSSEPNRSCCAHPAAGVHPALPVNRAAELVLLLRQHYFTSLSKASLHFDSSTAVASVLCLALTPPTARFPFASVRKGGHGLLPCCCAAFFVSSDPVASCLTPKARPLQQLTCFTLLRRSS